MRSVLLIAFLGAIVLQPQSLAGGCSDLHGQAHDRCLIERDQARQAERARDRERERAREAERSAERQRQEHSARENEARRLAEAQRQQDIQRRAEQERQQRISSAAATGGCSDLHGRAHDQCLVQRDQARQIERARQQQLERAREAQKAAERQSRQQQERAAHEEAKRHAEAQQRQEAQRRAYVDRQRHEVAREAEVRHRAEAQRQQDVQRRAEQERQNRISSAAASRGCSDLHGRAHDQCLAQREQARQGGRQRIDHERQLVAQREQQRTGEIVRQRLSESAHRTEILRQQEAQRRAEPERQRAKQDARLASDRGRRASEASSSLGSSLTTVRTPDGSFTLPNKGYYELSGSERAAFDMVVRHAQRLRVQGDNQAAGQIITQLPPNLRSIGNESVYGNARPAPPSAWDAASLATSLGPIGAAKVVGLGISKNLPTLYRGGQSLVARERDVVRNLHTNLLKTERGISLNANPAELERYGRVSEVVSIPDELRIVRTAGTHYEIAPRTSMTFERFQELLNQVVLK